MEQPIQYTNVLRNKVKEKINDARKNSRSITKELKDFTDMLYQYSIHPSYKPKETQRYTEEDAEIPRVFFLFVISKDGKERASFCINEKDKNRYSIISAMTELTDVNVFMSVSTFYPNAKNIAEKKPIFRRRKSQASRVNVLIADLDYYHLENSRFEGMKPEEVFLILKKELPQLFENNIPLTVVKSGNGLQIYLFSESLTVGMKKSYHFWKVCNQSFNKLFEEFGADATCIGDTARIFRLPESFNCKKEPIKVKLLTDVAKTPMKLEDLLQFLNLTPEDVILPKSKKQLRLEKVRNKNGQEFYDSLMKRRKTYQEEQKNEEYETWAQGASKEEIEKRKQKQIQYSQNGKKGFTSLTKKRLNDFETILENDDYNLEGRRNIFLFLYGITYYAYYQNWEQLFCILHVMNDKLLDPLEDWEVEQIATHIGNGVYKKLTNQYIVHVLELTEEDIKGLSISYTEEQRKEKDKNRSHVKYYLKFEDGISSTKKRIETNKKIIAKNLDKSNKVLMELTGLKRTNLANLKKIVRDSLK